MRAPLWLLPSIVIVVVASLISSSCGKTEVDYVLLKNGKSFMLKTDGKNDVFKIELWIETQRECRLQLTPIFDLMDISNPMVGIDAKKGKKELVYKGEWYATTAGVYVNDSGDCSGQKAQLTVVFHH